jgi:hypothetical protein
MPELNRFNDRSALEKRHEGAAEQERSNSGRE